MNNRRSIIRNCVIITREDDNDPVDPQKSLFYFVEEGAGNCIVNIDGYLIVPLEKVLGSTTKHNPGFFEKLLISMGIYVINVDHCVSFKLRLNRFFKFWFGCLK